MKFEQYIALTYGQVLAKCTDKERRFVEAYADNGTAAARDAGYEGNANTLGVIAHKIMQKPKILAALYLRETANTLKRIATREERQAFWTSVMYGEPYTTSFRGATVIKHPNLKERLKASELLGRSNSDFVDKIGLVNPDNENEPVEFRVTVVDPKKDTE
jgi:phage terminase small subunit